MAWLRNLGSLVLALAALAGSALAAAPAERRVALVIGNGGYRHVNPLDNAGNDARAMEQVLRTVGFETILKLDASRRDLYQVIDVFAGKLSAGAVGLFYYAGHGVQANDTNYLVPVDARVEAESDIEADGVDVQRVLKAMEAARAGLNIIILDACRDNPFPKARGFGRGLRSIDAPSGSFIAYAAAPGQTAQDGDAGGNGIYTGELVKVLEAPGLKIEDVFKKVGGGVSERTGGRQVPWTNSSLQGDFYFVAPADKAQLTAAVSPAASGGQPIAYDPRAADLAFWSAVKDAHDPDPFKAYLEQYPQGQFSKLAQLKLRELAPKPAAPPTAPVQPGRSFRDCAQCPEMVMLPAGHFMMGTDVAEAERERLPAQFAASERPRHPVRVSQPFALGKSHVTRGEYARFAQATGRGALGSCRVWTGAKFEPHPGRSWRDPGFLQSDRDPAVCVSWDDAKAYAAWLAKLTGKAYRLPTEAEWEYAARAGTTAPRWWGETAPNGYANCRGCGGVWDNQRTSPAASFPPNPFGLYDMLGNAWQWVEDCWAENYRKAPSEASVAFAAGGACATHAMRGGSWVIVPSYLHAGLRILDDAGERNADVGFRVARSE